MTMIASPSHHFQAMCSGPTSPVCTRVKEATISSTPHVALRGEQSTSTNESSPSTSNAQAPESGATSLAFVYGTLKRGFSNHGLMEQQMRAKHCRLVGIARTKHKYPLVCGPFQVPFLLNVCGSGYYVRGELYQVDAHCLALLDELEGTSNGHYVRSPLTLTNLELDLSFEADGQQGQHVSKLGGDIQAEAYFAASHFTAGLFRSALHIEAYTEKEAATYTRRVLRPKHRTFLQHVYHWIDEKTLQSSTSPVIVSSTGIEV